MLADTRERLVRHCPNADAGDRPAQHCPDAIATSLFALPPSKDRDGPIVNLLLPTIYFYTRSI